MMLPNGNRNFIKNLIYAFSAQGISLLLSLLISLVVPKLLGVEEFGYWQLFLFYINYAGLTHMGLIDGVYLRLGGKKYCDLDYSLLGSQFWMLVIEQVIISIIIVFGAFFLESDSKRHFVWIMACIYMVIFNTSYYLGFIFQATNRTKQFSISIMIDKLSFIICVILLLLFREKNFEVYIILYTVAKIFALAYSISVGHDIVFAPVAKVRIIIHEAIRNIVIGINLLLANMAGMLILGVGRLIVDYNWGIEAFGKFSFAISITNFFLMFINQISMVLFPALRQINSEDLKKIYCSIRDALGVFLPSVFLLYFPIKYVLSIWLPEYKESLEYIAILLPLCTFDGKMQMLYSTYLKVLRKERVLLIVNIASLGISIILSLIGAYFFHSIYAIVISNVAAVAFRSVLTEIYLSKVMHLSVVKELICEILLAILFVCLSCFITPLISFIAYLIVYVCYLILNKSRVKNLINTTKFITMKKSVV